MQPLHGHQAAGSSLLAKLCNILVQDALGTAGMLDVVAITVLPVATGMALTLTLLAMKAQRPATARQEVQSTPDACDQLPSPGRDNPTLMPVWASVKAIHTCVDM